MDYQPLAALWEGLLTISALQEGLSTPLCPLGGPTNPSLLSGRASQPLLVLRKGVPSPPGPLGGRPDHSRPSKRGWEAHLVAPAVVGRGREAYLEGWQGAGGPPAGL